MSNYKKRGRPFNTSIERLPIKQEEFESLLMYCDQFIIKESTRLKLVKAFTILYHSGCRISELLQLDKNHIASILKARDLSKAGSFSLNNTTKTKKPRLVLISKQGVEDIAEIWEMEICEEVDNMSEKIFPGKNGKPLGVTGFTALINKHMKLALESDLFSSHSFRQGLLSSLISDAKIPVSTVSAMIGHASINTTLRYHRSTKIEQAEALEMVR